MEMDILFKNTHTRTKDVVKEMFRYLLFCRGTSITAFALFGLCFVLNIVPVFFLEFYEVNLYILIFIPIYMIIYGILYAMQVNITLKRDIEIYGKPVDVETSVTDECIHLTASSGSVNKIEFHSIKYAAHTKNLILLMTKAKLIVAFRKDSFSVGTKDEFIAFLKSKGIKVKGK